MGYHNVYYQNDGEMQNECILQLHAYDFLIIEIQWFFLKLVAKIFARRIANWDWNIILEV